MDRETVTRALEERRVLRVNYGGRERIVQPHAILRRQDGTELLEAYQVRGGSESGPEPGWRHFDLARLTEVELLAEHFEPRPDFRPQSGEGTGRPRRSLELVRRVTREGESET